MSKASWCKKAPSLFLLCAATAAGSSQQGFTTLVSFNGPNGFYPYGAPVRGTDGDLYGTTLFGGANNAGTVFKVTPTGALTTLYSFCSQANCADGQYPGVGLVLGSDGSFYGTTGEGASESCGGGCGTVFKITPEGVLATLHRFNVTDGFRPEGTLVQGTDGNLYGTTLNGGTAGTACGSSGCGVIFRITPAGALTTLHSFDGTDGWQPLAGLIQAADGDFYGTTELGPTGPIGVACNLGDGCGTVFKITPAGALTTLHSFDLLDGDFPAGGLIQGTDGNFYGTTGNGGAGGMCAYACGTVFKITPEGTLTTLHSFNLLDGANPIAGLIQASDGNLYGTTSSGGPNVYATPPADDGTVFRITPAGVLTTVHSFDGSDGADPMAPLVEGAGSILYGTTQSGGSSGDGTVFSLGLEAGPVVLVLPVSATVGQRVLILGIPGTTLTGATTVTFNGTPAAFTILTPSLVRASVPAGATSGTVLVTTPSGSIPSKLPFRVQ